MPRLFAQTRPTTWPIIVLAVVAYACSILFVNAVLFQGRISQALGSLYVATAFLIQSALVGGLLALAVVAVVVFGLGRLRASDVGWSASELKWGLLATIGFWVTMQIVALVVATAVGEVNWHEDWQRRGASGVIGGLLGQLLGNALVEETVFHGFLLPQLHLKANQVLRTAFALMIAMIGSSVVFAVTHIPNRLLVRELAGMDLLWDQAGLFFAGLIFAVTYIVTRNLFVAVGLHALANEPVSLFRASNEVMQYVIWFGLTVVLLIGWWMVQAARLRTATPPLSINLL